MNQVELLFKKIFKYLNNCNEKEFIKDFVKVIGKLLNIYIVSKEIIMER